MIVDKNSRFFKSGVRRRHNPHLLILAVVLCLIFGLWEATVAQDAAPVNMRPSDFSITAHSVVDGNKLDTLIQNEIHRVPQPTAARVGFPSIACDVHHRSNASSITRELVALIFQQLFDQNEKSPLDILTLLGADISKSKFHHESIIHLLTKYRECWSRLWTILHETRATDTQPEEECYFIDGGCRSGDQTLLFLKRYPEAKAKFKILAFEANPHFNPIMNGLVVTHSPNLIFLNFALGVRNESRRMTDRDVGSSIVHEDLGAGNLKTTKLPLVTFPVVVVDFSEFLLQQVMHLRPQRLDAIPILRRHKVVVKLDVEKMEFPILHHMLITGTILLVDELLVECHYTTNQRDRSKRRPSDLGMDDCVALMRAFQQTFPVPFEFVLWNNVKTASKSSPLYMTRHGGFKPT